MLQQTILSELKKAVLSDSLRSIFFQDVNFSGCLETTFPPLKRFCRLLYCREKTPLSRRYVSKFFPKFSSDDDCRC